MLVTKIKATDGKKKRYPTPRKYIVENKAKYINKKADVTLRSSLEVSFATRLDKNPDVLWWASEEFSIPYLINGKQHNYWPDFSFGLSSKTVYIVEIKPEHEVWPPKELVGKCTKKQIDNYNNSVETYSKNVAKWIAADKYSSKKNATFIIVTEKNKYIFREQVLATAKKYFNFVQS